MQLIPLFECASVQEAVSFKTSSSIAYIYILHLKCEFEESGVIPSTWVYFSCLDGQIRAKPFLRICTIG